MPTRFNLFRRLLTIPIALLVGSSALVAQPTWKQVITPDAGGHISEMCVTHLTDGSGGTVVTVMQQRPTNGGTYCTLYNPDLETAAVIGKNKYSHSSWTEKGNCGVGYPVTWYIEQSIDSGVIWDFVSPYDPDRHVRCYAYKNAKQYRSSNCTEHESVEETFTLLCTQGMSFDSCPISSFYTSSNKTLPSLSSSTPLPKVYFHPTDGTILFAATDSGLVRSQNSSPGCPSAISKWAGLKPATGTSCFVAIPDISDCYFYGAHDTLWHSTDAGASWGDVLHGTVNAVLHIPKTQTFIAASNAGTQPGLFISTDNGETFQRVLSESIFAIDIDVATNTIFAGTQGRIYFSSDSGKSFGRSLSSPNNLPVIGIASTQTTITCADSMGAYSRQLPSSINERIAAPNIFGISVSPNPFTDLTNIVVTGDIRQVSKLRIVDILGRVISTLIPGATNVIKGSEFPAGYYDIQAIGFGVAQITPLIHLR